MTLYKQMVLRLKNAKLNQIIDKSTLAAFTSSSFVIYLYSLNYGTTAQKIILLR